MRSYGTIHCGYNTIRSTLGANFGICQYVEESQEERAVKGQSRDPCVKKRPAPTRRGMNIYSQLLGLEDVGLMISWRMMNDDLIPEGHAQVVSGSVTLPDLSLYPWRQRIRHSKESRMSVMFLKHWVTTSVTPECLSIMSQRLPGGC